MFALPTRSSAFRRHFLAWGCLLGFALGAGCVDEPPACYEGEYTACPCGDAEGYALCEGGQYGACDCTSPIPGLGGGAAQASGGAGGAGGEGGSAPELLGFLEPCDEDEQCETGLCHPFNAKGPHCSQPCSDASDCPPPSPGCNMMGICKVP